MALQVGLVGLPNVGKSTLFNAVCRASAEVASFPFSTIEPNVGVVPVPDPRLERVAELAGSDRSVPTALRVVDIAGLVAGASHGDGLGNRFLAHIREVDAVCHVVRCFDDDSVAHVSSTVDPVSDIEVVTTELVLKDLETVEQRLEKTRRAAKGGDRELARDARQLEELRDHLAADGLARTYLGELAPELEHELFLLTAKPVLYAANVAEEHLPDGDHRTEAVRKLADAQGAHVVVICAELEAELAALDPDEGREYLAALGLERSGLEQLVRHAYTLLGLRTFFTANRNEARAWTVPVGTTAVRAAREVHSDFERGFIRAEVISFEEYDALGGETGARDAGRMRVEGREYVVEDGDVIHFRT